MTEKKPPLNRRRLSQIVLLAMVIILLAGLARFIHHRLNFAVTNAVFVASDSLTEIGFDRISGTLLELKKKEGEVIHKGELLARIDPTPYQLEVERLQAELNTADRQRAALQLKRRRLGKELNLQVQMAAADIERLQHEQQAQQARSDSLKMLIEQLQRDRQRYRNLLKQQVIARHRLESLETELDSKQAELRAIESGKQALDPAITTARLKRRLARAQLKQLDELDQQLKGAEQNVRRLQARLDKARRDLRNTSLFSPIEGRVAKRLVTPNSQVSPGRPVYALVNPAELYLNALLEENKLEGVQPGAEVSISMDAYPDLHWQGEVEQILPASAATFALAPRDISAGEFTKVAQRIPVRIRITGGPRELLRVGLGGEIEIRRQKG
ncbi:EmrA/EmrK family multidrug efflux transporter periplasmic adaptor subunit [Geothermobacter hydrogeniphilus]|uniref:EmrA/EmrK family multidrug efflux transporter periplasmic adaptor subunit n=1 Tax=Geothermobacter hydrogeniphilus TaxID=1969733 RepID=A0A2K2H8Q9_9BACT|nr:HlyD family secretion protein [Geothermobacter hydrogeniphilus]PNU19704.1 EmrA/EmrK family multidrug efflux transporter periplasmic adaptor subunit [Geothermobacter hydrogeniphilus]